MAFDVDQFLAQTATPNPPPINNDTIAAQTGTADGAPAGGFDVDSFLKTTQDNAHLPNPAQPESSYGDVLSQSATNAKLGLMQSVGGLMQGIGEAPTSAIQELAQPAPSGISLPYNLKQLLAKGEIAATALPAALAPDAFGSLADTGKTIQQEATAEQRENQPNVTPGSLEGKVGLAAQIGLQLAPALLVPEAIPEMFGAQGFGSTYAEQRNAGQSGGNALLPSVTSGIANGAIGELPLGVLTSETGGLGVKLLKGAIVGEVTGQGLNAVQQGINKGTIDPNMTWDQFKQSAKDMGGIGAVLGAAGAGISHIARGAPATEPPAPPPPSPLDIPQQAFNPQTGRMEDVGGEPPAPPNPPAGAANAAPESAQPNDVPPLPAATPTLDDKINSGQVTSGDLRTMLQNGTAQFVDGKLQETPVSTQSAAPIDPQSVVTATASGGNVDPEVLRLLLNNGSIGFDSAGKLQASTTAQVDILPLAQNARLGSLDNLLSQLKTPDSANPTTFNQAVSDFQEKNKLVDSLKSTSNTPIAANDIPHSDIESVGANLDAISANNPQGLNTGVLHDLINTGFVKIGADGHPEMTDQGTQLHNEIKNPSEAVTPEEQAQLDQYLKDKQPKLALPSPDQFPGGVIAADSAGNARVMNEGDLAAIERAKQQAQNMGLTPDVLRAQARRESPSISESEPQAPEPKALPSPESFPSDAIAVDRNGSARRLTESEVAEIDRKRQESENAGLTPDVIKAQADRAAGEGAGKQFSATPANPDEARLAELEREHDALPPDSPRKAEILSEMEAVGDKIIAGTKPTLTDQFGAKKQAIADRVTSIIKRINPDVDVKVVRKLFGEGEGLKDSGLKSADRQEVAGSFEKLKNLITASLNTEKWNPLDTAYHEAYHSVRDMIRPADDVILKKAFPGTDKLSQEEHEAVEFGRFMTEKNATGFMPAVRRVFSSIRQAMRDIGSALKLGKFNSVEDIFNRVERGGVYGDYVKSLKSGDIAALKSARLAPDQQRQAVREASPALYDAVYSATGKDDEAISRLNAENNGTPTEKLSAYASGLYDKATSVADVAKEKMLRASVDALKPIASEKFIKEKLADVDNTIARTGKKFDSEKSPLNGAYNLGQMLLASNDGRMRWMGRAFKSDTIGKIADFFHPDPGTGRTVAETYPEEMSRVINTARNTLAHVYEGLSRPDLEKVTYYMQHPEELTKEVTATPVGKAAAVSSRIVQDMRDNLAGAGYEVPEVQGFFPRIYDTAKVVANEQKFKQQAKLAYLDTYKDYFAGKPVADVASELNDMVNRWFNNVSLQDQGIDTGANDFTSVPTSPPAPSSFKARTLSKAADDIMRDYLVQDPVSAMSGLIYKSARKSAWERRFGDGKWEALKDQMQKEGINGDGIQAITEMIKSNTGQMGMTVPSNVKNALSVARYYGALRYLSKVAFLHTSLPLLTGIRTGNVMNAFRAYHDSIRALLSNGDAARNTKLFSEMLGLTGESAEHMLMMQQMGDMPNEKLRYANDRYYDRIGITKLVSAAKQGAIRPIQYFISHLSDDILNHGDSQKSSEFLSRELGIPSDKLQDFAQWVKDGGGKSMQQSLVLDRSDPNAVLYQTAMRRAMDQIIQNPTPATRQLYANHPVGSMIYSLGAYKMAYAKNVLQRAYRMTTEAGATGKGYTMADRLALATPAMMLPLTVAFSAAYEEAKDAMFPPDKPFKGNKTMRALNRSEVFGEFDGLADYIASRKFAAPIVGNGYAKEYAKSQRYSNILGPNASLYNNLSDMVTKLPDISSGTTKQKQAEARRLYDMVLAPAVSGAVATYSPYALPAFGAIQAINSPQVRRKIIGGK